MRPTDPGHANGDLRCSLRGRRYEPLNIRVADTQAVYKEWSAKGAEFLRPPVDRGVEIRCYMRDPNGHLIEVRQATSFR